MSKRLPFHELFNIVNDRYQPRQAVIVNGIKVFPNTYFSRQSNFGGLNLSVLSNKDLQITIHPDGMYEITAYYV